MFMLIEATPPSRSLLPAHSYQATIGGLLSMKGFPYHPPVGLVFDRLNGHTPTAHCRGSHHDHDELISITMDRSITQNG